VLQRRWRTATILVAATTVFVGAAAFRSRPPDNLEITGGKTAVGGGDCVLTGKCAIPTLPQTTTTTAARPSQSTTRPTTPAKPTPTTKPPLVSSGGWKVSAVGDSVLLGASQAVEYTLTGPAGGAVLVNAAVSRHAGTCIQVLQAFAAQSVLAPLVIVHCGNNGALGTGFVDQVMQIAGPHRHVVFVSLKVPRGWEGPDNAQLAADVPRYPNARMFDWYNIGVHLKPQNAYFYNDLYHLNPTGRSYYASHLLKALQIWHWL
jgi:hypothetical protein